MCCLDRCEDGCTDRDPLVDASGLYVCDCDGLEGYELGSDSFSCVGTSSQNYTFDILVACSNTLVKLTFRFKY